MGNLSQAILCEKGHEHMWVSRGVVRATQTQTHTHTHTHTHTQTHTHTHSFRHTQTHNTHTLTDTHKHKALHLVARTRGERGEQQQQQHTCMAVLLWNRWMCSWRRRDVWFASCSWHSCKTPTASSWNRLPSWWVTGDVAGQHEGRK